MCTLLKSRFCCSVYSNHHHHLPLYLPAPLPLSLYRCAAGDADASGEEDLSIPADGGHAFDHPYLPDTTVQASL